MDGSKDDLPGKLPAPAPKGKMSLEEALEARESVRDFSSRPLAPEELSQQAIVIRPVFPKSTFDAPIK